MYLSFSLPQAEYSSQRTIADVWFSLQADVLLVYAKTHQLRHRLGIGQQIIVIGSTASVSPYVYAPKMQTEKSSSSFHRLYGLHAKALSCVQHARFPGRNWMLQMHDPGSAETQWS